ncbi:hypothetical protein BZL30_2980 [Mycobacterium kansasii]|uniref:Uncharacterized protein n=1 Tax=Mycobacterium kansasii TaxID=1768 RepID=A0A1V3XLW4_MYCKA|nr:hypothetical protein BZL30_2980 [Mycobacterium kansasii]OOK80204.1 hypothetical protein BZL29_2903 [Mycobacterium kansasii]
MTMGSELGPICAPGDAADPGTVRSAHAARIRRRANRKRPGVAIDSQPGRELG